MQFHPEYDIHGECGLLFAQLMIKKFHINKSLKYVAKDIVEAPIWQNKNINKNKVAGSRN